MSLIIQEALQAHRNVLLETVAKDLPDIKVKSKNLRLIVTKYLIESEEELLFISDLNRIKILMETTLETVDKLNGIKKNLNELGEEELKNAKQTLGNYPEQLKAIEENLTLCRSLTENNIKLDRVKSLISEEQFFEAAEIIKELLEIDITICPDLLKSFKEQVKRECAQLKYILANNLNEMINFTQSSEDAFEVYTIKIKSGETIEKLLKAYGLVQTDLDPLTDIVTFIDHIFTQIVQHVCNLSIALKEDENVNELVLKVSKQHKSDMNTVFFNILKASKFFQCSYKFQLTQETTTMDHLRKNIEERLKTLIINCLKENSPTSEEALDKYNDVKQLATDLQQELCSYELLDPKSIEIVDFVENIETYFAGKKCNELSNQAMALMTKDLHDTIIVGDQLDYSKGGTSFEHQFAQCAVSKSVQELLKLIEKILSMANTTQYEKCASDYVKLCSDILKMYFHFTHNHHEKLLKTIPQQLAIFYNNCKYLCCNVESLWKLMPQKHESNAPFDVKTTLTTKAREMFETYVLNQAEQIKSTIDSVNIPKSVDALNVNTEKAVRQCLRQQELLKTVWQKVLNHDDYNRALGILLNALTSKFVVEVLRFNDISMEVAEQLVETIKIVLTRGPKLFADPKEVHVHVETWDRLNELVFVLNSDLLGIRERWAEGKGPMALYLSASELKKLVQALFAPSDRRADLLTIIK